MNIISAPEVIDWVKTLIDSNIPQIRGCDPDAMLVIQYSLGEKGDAGHKCVTIVRQATFPGNDWDAAPSPGLIQRLGNDMRWRQPRIKQPMLYELKETSETDESFRYLLVVPVAAERKAPATVPCAA